MDIVRGLLPGQFGGVDAAPRFIGQVLEAKKDVAQIALQFVDCVRRSVGKGLFRLRPDVLVRIEFGRIGRKAMNLEPQEGDHPFAVDIVPMALKIQPDPLAQRRYGNRGDNRDFGSPVTMPKDRRPADRDPGLSHVGDEHEPAFVEEDEMSTQAPGVFFTRHRYHKPSVLAAAFQLAPLASTPPPAPLFSLQVFDGYCHSAIN